jgi:hypothetical protein
MSQFVCSKSAEIKARCDDCVSRAKNIWGRSMDAVRLRPIWSTRSGRSSVDVSDISGKESGEQQRAVGYQAP